MRPIIYQIFTRLYGSCGKHPQPWGGRNVNGCGTMTDIDAKALNDIHDMGFTHVWCTGIIRHATCTHYDGVPDCNPRVVKGIAGSPYAITDYYDVDPDLAVNPDRRREEYLALVERVHQAGLKLVIDFVPNHVSREYHSICCPQGVRDLGFDDDTTQAFSPNNNFYYIPGETLHTDNLPVHEYSSVSAPYVECPARATGNDVFHAWPGCNDWYETVKLNYGIDYATGSRHFDPIPDTWLKMTDILLHWASTGVDAFRCDMAEMVPVEFWHYAIARVKGSYPGVCFIAEIYNPAQYRNYIFYGGFDYLYDKVGMYDCLRNVMCGYLPAEKITTAWQNVDDILPKMLYFIENHDEQRVASPQFANNAYAGRAGMLAAASISTAPLMVYFGQEIGEPALDSEGYSGQDGRTTIFDYWTLDKVHRMLQGRLTCEEKVIREFYGRLLRACNQSAALREGKFYDLMYANPTIVAPESNTSSTGSTVASSVNPVPCDSSTSSHLVDNAPVHAGFDARCTYVCLRYTQHELALIVCNFAPESRTESIVIPPEAFEHISLKACKRPVIMRDLLSDYTIKTPLLPAYPITLTIPAQSGVIMVKSL